MVIGSLKNTERVEALNPFFKKVFDYIKSHDLTNAPVGRIDIDGDNAWINVVEVDGKDKSAAKLETHNAYIDVQLPLIGCETFGWKGREMLTGECPEGYSSEKDITFYTDPAAIYFTLTPGDFGIFFPEDGHAPCIGQGKIKKAIVKVKA